jgi:predicted ATP-binding protein involved in virulence
MRDLSKQELMREMKLFYDDKERGISLRNFCEIAGISERLFVYVFHEKKLPLTEDTQRKVNRAYKHWKEGRIKVMKKRNNETYPDYRKEPHIPYMTVSKLVLTDNGVKINISTQNRHDYANFNNILSKRG